MTGAGQGGAGQGGARLGADSAAQDQDAVPCVRPAEPSAKGAAINIRDILDDMRARREITKLEFDSYVQHYCVLLCFASI